jgi:hypothetical protein
MRASTACCCRLAAPAASFSAAACCCRVSTCGRRAGAQAAQAGSALRPASTAAPPPQGGSVPQGRQAGLCSLASAPPAPQGRRPQVGPKGRPGAAPSTGGPRWAAGAPGAAAAGGPRCSSRAAAQRHLVVRRVELAVRLCQLLLLLQLHRALLADMSQPQLGLQSAGAAAGRQGGQQLGRGSWSARRRARSKGPGTASAGAAVPGAGTHSRSSSLCSLSRWTSFCARCCSCCCCTSAAATASCSCARMACSSRVFSSCRGAVVASRCRAPSSAGELQAPPAAAAAGGAPGCQAGDRRLVGVVAHPVHAIQHLLLRVALADLTLLAPDVILLHALRGGVDGLRLGVVPGQRSTGRAGQHTGVTGARRCSRGAASRALALCSRCALPIAPAAHAAAQGASAIGIAAAPAPGGLASGFPPWPPPARAGSARAAPPLRQGRGAQHPPAAVGERSAMSRLAAHRGPGWRAPSCSARGLRGRRVSSAALCSAAGAKPSSHRRGPGGGSAASACAACRWVNRGPAWAARPNGGIRLRRAARPLLAAQVVKSRLTLRREAPAPAAPAPAQRPTQRPSQPQHAHAACRAPCCQAGAAQAAAQATPPHPLRTTSTTDHRVPNPHPPHPTPPHLGSSISALLISLVPGLIRRRWQT